MTIFLPFSRNIYLPVSRSEFCRNIIFVTLVIFPSIAHSADAVIATQNYVDSVDITKEDISNKTKSVSGGGTGITSASTDTQYPTAKATYDGLVLKEDLSNKVRSTTGGGAGITSTSTDIQYPTAKAAYDGLNTKINKATGAVSGNIATFDSTGQVLDSGKKPSDFVEMTGDQTVAGTKTFQAIPLIPTATLPSI
jgi:hypothetical protein